jgi:bifunctional aspartokinase / homoserine dehydrogenase 1
MDKILKFGGTSVGSVDAIKQLVEIVSNDIAETKKVAVVVSAFSKVTDQLIEISNMSRSGDDRYIELLNGLWKRHNAVISILIKKNVSKTQKSVNDLYLEMESILKGIYLIKELSPKTMDHMMSFGERLSALIIADVFCEYDIEAGFLDARNVVYTNDNYNNAKVDFVATNKNIKKYFTNNNNLQIITGFIGSTNDGKYTTTLGRGGSDYSASIFGAALNSKVIEIWTDVDGVMTADPRKVSNAFTVDSMTYQEAMEIAHFGAKVIYPPTMKPALISNVPLVIRNTFNPKFKGTIISNKKNANDKLIVKGITSLKDISLISVEGSGMIGVPGIAGRTFESLAKRGINIILITQASSEQSICFAVQSMHADETKQLLELELANELHSKDVDHIKVEDDLVIIAVVGSGMSNRPGVASQVFSAMGDNNINIRAIAQGSSELNISFVINKNNEEDALKSIHNRFFGNDIINLFLVGAGNVGKELIKQIRQLKDNNIRVTYLGNRDNYYFDKNGIDLNKWDQLLIDSKLKTDYLGIVESLNQVNGKKIFVDCTASTEYIGRYKELLKQNVNIVTPNKKANSQDIVLYKEIRDALKISKAKFLYETNVGAGLPIISTINNFIKSGDKVTKVEGILSGTLSYIFNTFSTEIKFSQLVKQAQSKGYTEPDPRDDLNGLDVARKILIIARELGYEYELTDIQINNFISNESMNAKNVESFYKNLEKYDDNILQNKLTLANQQNKKLRFIAKFEAKKITLGLDMVDSQHPFYNLNGTDNIIAIYSKRYSSQPLVIKGPGAGVGVTASGILADILSIY